MSDNLITTYYTSHSSLKRRMRKNYRSFGFKGPYEMKAFSIWQDEAKEKLSSVLGLQVIERDAGRLDFNERREDIIETEDGIKQEHTYIDTEEDVTMPLFILHPQGETKGTFIALAGHNGAGKESVAGIDRNPLVREKIEKYNYDYGLYLAKLGYTVICPDPRGFGERREKDEQGDEGDKYLKSSCKELSQSALALGFTLQGLLVWDIMRLIDYIETRDDITIEDLGVIGFSGGGMQALYASALDQRIRKVMISGYFYGFEDSLLELNSNCPCNYVPSLFTLFDMGDIASLIAPRPLAIQSCLRDHLEGRRGMENVTEQLEILKKSYDLFNKPIFHDTPEGDHAFHKERLKEILAFFEKERI